MKYICLRLFNSSSFLFHVPIFCEMAVNFLYLPSSQFIVPGKSRFWLFFFIDILEPLSLFFILVLNHINYDCCFS